jgi:pyruvate/2-oxoglutarate dehydrogenase complex dihydrolipoamide acyltransferase (E2) component
MIDVVLDAPAWKDVEPGTQALLDKWLVAEGDAVRAGQPLAAVVLIKATLEIAAPADGVVASIRVPEGETFGPGQPLALLRPSS